MLSPLRVLLVGITLSLGLRIDGPSVARPACNRAAAPQLVALDKLPPATVPKTVDNAKEAFFAAMAPRMASMPVQAFANNVISSTQYALVAPSYVYSRVWAVGFAALCDVFLELSEDPSLKELIRTSLAYSLGMEAGSLAADSEALRGIAAGKTEAELLQ